MSIDRGLNPSQASGEYFATYVERDVRQLTAVHDLQRFERFVLLCAGRVGQILNLTSLRNDAGGAQSTARAWIAVLVARPARSGSGGPGPGLGPFV